MSVETPGDKPRFRRSLLKMKRLWKSLKHSAHLNHLWSSAFSHLPWTEPQLRGTEKIWVLLLHEKRRHSWEITGHFWIMIKTIIKEKLMASQAVSPICLKKGWFYQQGKIWNAFTAKLYLLASSLLVHELRNTERQNSFMHNTLTVKRLSMNLRDVLDVTVSNSTLGVLSEVNRENKSHSWACLQLHASKNLSVFSHL